MPARPRPSLTLVVQQVYPCQPQSGKGHCGGRGGIGLWPMIYRQVTAGKHVAAMVGEHWLEARVTSPGQGGASGPEVPERQNDYGSSFCGNWRGGDGWRARAGSPCHFSRAKVAPPARRCTSVKMIMAPVFAVTGMAAMVGEHGLEARVTSPRLRRRHPLAEPPDNFRRRPLVCSIKARDSATQRHRPGAVANTPSIQ